MTGAELVSLLAPHSAARFSEAELQSSVEDLLRKGAVSYEREVEVDGGRIDFLIGTIGLEIKIDVPVNGVSRQLLAYAQGDRISELVLLTLKRQHKRVPSRLAGKRVHVVALAPF